MAAMDRISAERDADSKRWAAEREAESRKWAAERAAESKKWAAEREAESEKWEKSLAKTDARLDRLSVTMAEIMEGHKQTQAELRELRVDVLGTQASVRELRAELKEIEERADRRCKKMDARIDKLGKFYGGLGDNVGHHAEEFFQNALETSLSFGGIKFDDLIRNLKFAKHESCEFDMALVSRESAAIIEAKNRVHHKSIVTLATKKVAQFRKFYPEHAHCRIYLGVAGFSFDPEVVAEAKKYGVGVIRQVGDAVQVDKGRLKVY
jgi:DNA repair exonuclease SbcCD ATPase subunit